MAKEIPYFRFTAFEWLNGDISLESKYLKGLFIDICAYYWFKDCSITLAMLNKKEPNDIDGILDLIRLNIIKHEKKGDFLKIVFLDEQYDLLSEKRTKRQIAGALGGKKKASNATILLQQKPSYKDKDKENNKDKENIVEIFNFSKSLLELGIDKSVLEDWLKVRKLKKCANTETAYKSIKKQIESSGVAPNDCIIKAVEKSWGGFEAEWIKKTNNIQNGNNKRDLSEINHGTAKRLADM